MPTSAFLPTDSISQARSIIDPVHEAVHDAIYYTAHHLVTVGTATAATLLITPPAEETGYKLHFTADIITNNAGIITLSESPNASGGTVIVSYNHFREVGENSPATITHTATYVSAGTVIDTFISSGTSTNQVKIGTDDGSVDEWIPDPSKLYLIRFVADNAATRVLMKCRYYYRSH